MISEPSTFRNNNPIIRINVAMIISVNKYVMAQFITFRIEIPKKLFLTLLNAVQS